MTVTVDDAARLLAKPTPAPVPGQLGLDQTHVLNVLSLFAGIGGLELGLERAGMRVVGQVEMNPFCQRVLAHHWPEVPRHDDVCTAPDWWSSQPRPQVDVVCGGYPCQPFSLAGRQHGIADERWLWPAMADVVRRVRPRYVVVENVAALVRAADAFGWMLGDLADLGLDAEWAVLSAPEFGAPQAARERVYLVAYPPSLHGKSRDHMGEGGDRQSPLAARGLFSLPVAARRESARQWLAAEPRVDRLAHGLPAQVDELAAYGNAVMPIAGEHIGRLILDDFRAGVIA
ncbi:DNA cytosine methyltransferase [Streptomyces sp. Isolate_219]|uniref:DNA cytosine methyltransferase n=1 Tax=Streptomyces sp. Isolate_219 TaxID=2950110 RepID=UPI0021C9F048|nr:DNA (cytosine-5-)-methyltransferase [Streptomyces sp. Isolate_219]MCR8576186.1 DNA (cytosine-5-)-methyltransferase [Streptomyces sp. Isolate_219]